MTCFSLSFPVTLFLIKDTGMKEGLKRKLVSTRQSLAATARDISYNQHFKTDNGISRDEGIALNVVANHLMRLYHLIGEVLDCKEGEKPRFDIDSANLLLFSGYSMKVADWEDDSMIVGARFPAARNIEERFSDLSDIFNRNQLYMEANQHPYYLVLFKDEELRLYSPGEERRLGFEIAPDKVI